MFFFHTLVGLTYASDICKKQKKYTRSFLAMFIEVVKNLVMVQKSDKSLFSIWCHIRTNCIPNKNHIYS